MSTDLGQAANDRKRSTAQETEEEKTQGLTAEVMVEKDRRETIFFFFNSP